MRIQPTVSARRNNRTPQHVGLRLAVLAICLGPGMPAQTPVVPNNAQPFFYPAPPAGFDPVAVSDEDLATYGFPRRPAPGDPYYTTWARMVSNARKRIDKPVATTTTTMHGPKRGSASSLSRSAVRAANGSENDYSTNWSGEEVQYPSTPGYFAQNGSTAYIGFQPPVLGAEDCSYAPYHTSVWAGFDGDFNPDVLQAGVDVAYDSNCLTSYVAWYEWYTPGCTVNSPTYPCYQTNVNLAVNPGDEMYVTVTYSTTSPNGTAFISDQTTGYYVSVGFNQPPGNSGTGYVGSTAEWIVERPTNSNGSLFDLGNYSVPDGPYGFLWIYPDYTPSSLGGVIPAGEDPASAVIFDYMYCIPSDWNPSSACPLVNGGGQYISFLYYQQIQPPGSCIWPEVLCFYPTGPAANQ